MFLCLKVPLLPLLQALFKAWQSSRISCLEKWCKASFGLCSFKGLCSFNPKKGQFRLSLAGCFLPLSAILGSCGCPWASSLCWGWLCSAKRILSDAILPGHTQQRVRVCFWHLLQHYFIMLLTFCLSKIWLWLGHHLGTVPCPDFALAASSRHSPALISSFLSPGAMPFGTGRFWHRDLSAHVPSRAPLLPGFSGECQGKGIFLAAETCVGSEGEPGLRCKAVVAVQDHQHRYKVHL